ncbi:MAG: cadherin-like beta sandwich domain-containing protein [Longicatena sp.]
MKILRKLPVYLFISCMAMSLFMLSGLSVIFASSISAGASTSTVAPGGSFTVSVSINGGGSGMFYFSGSNATVSTGSQYCDGGCSITATAGSSGTATVNISTGAPGTANEVTDQDGNPMSFSSAVSVSIIAPNNGGNTGGNAGNSGGGNTGNNTPTTPTNPDEKDETKDSDSSLASLSVSDGELSPAFASATTSYEVNLPAGTTKLTVDAKAKSAKASVSGTGALDVKTGENNLEVVCTAENGASTVYKIKVNVSEKPVATIKYGKKNLGVLNQSTDVSKLFTETKVTIDGKEVIAWKNEALKMTLLYMQDEKTGEKNLYIYDEAKKEVTSIYKPFAFAGKNLVMVDIPKELQERKGMKLSTVKLGDVEVNAWVFEDKTFANYALLYVMDEAGNMVYYQYEKKENSLQLFSQAAAITQDSYQTYVEKMEGRNQTYLIAICVLSLLSVGLLITTITLFIKRKNNAKFKKVKIENEGLSAEAKSLLNKD